MILYYIYIILYHIYILYYIVYIYIIYIHMRFGVGVLAAGIFRQA